MTGSVAVTVAVLGLATFAMRSSSLVVADRVAGLPEPALRVLRLVAPAALAALVAPPLLLPEGRVDPLSPATLAGAAAALVAWRTRNVLATLIVGLGGATALRLLGV